MTTPLKKYRRVFAYLGVVAAAILASYFTTQIATEESRKAAADEAAKQANQKIYESEVNLYLNQLEACERLNKLRAATYAVMIGVKETQPYFSRVFGIDDQIRVLLQTEAIDPQTGRVTCTEITERPTVPHNLPD